MSRQKLTIIVPAGNEEANIVACLESCRRIADELIVVDSFSQDKTVVLATPIADRVLQHEYINSAAQKNWAIPQAAHPWVMIVDADERVTPELADEIEAVLLDPQHDGWRIHRLNHFLGKPIRHCGWNRDKVLRLFRRDVGRYQERHVHADVIGCERIGALQGRLIHHTCRELETYMRKHERYTSWAAKDRAQTTGRVGFHHLAFHPAWRFLKQYVLRLGFLDGKAGFMVCWLSAHSAFMKYAKLWETQRRAESPDDFGKH
jgi:glycosyltransferase involved in cell wall biosynthesis